MPDEESENLEPELRELNKLPDAKPIFLEKRAMKRYISPYDIPELQVLQIDNEPILNWAQNVSQRINEASLLIASNQDQNNQKILDANHLCWKSVNHVASCGAALNALEFQISEGMMITKASFLSTFL